jgi:hypothetical protein
MSKTVILSIVSKHPSAVVKFTGVNGLQASDIWCK